MENKVINKTPFEFKELTDLIQGFSPFAKEKMGFDKSVVVELISDEENAKQILGKSAYYVPDEHKVCIYVDGRHPKDILRSISHELMHHTQNCRGEFEHNEPKFYKGYAQKDDHLREMEKEAYAASIVFRDYEDNIKFKEGMKEESQITLALMERFIKKPNVIVETKTPTETNHLSQTRQAIFARMKG
jgi:hypothetical protein